jgi:hypothetical protein
MQTARHPKPNPAPGVVYFFMPQGVIIKLMQPKYYGAAAEYNKPQSTGLGKILKLVGMVVGIIVLITIAYFAFMALTSGGRNSAATLVAREKQLITFMTSNQATIENDNLRTINSSGSTLITSDHYALSQGLKASYGLATPPEEITKAEADTTSKKTLDNAKIQSRFDVVFVELLQEKIASTQQLARTVRDGSNGALKTAAEATIKNLTTIDEQLAKLQL